MVLEVVSWMGMAAAIRGDRPERRRSQAMVVVSTPNVPAVVSHDPWTDQNSGMAGSPQDRSSAQRSGDGDRNGGRETARDLCAYVDASPSPYHAVAETARRLVGAGFTEVDLDAPVTPPGRHFLRSGGALIAWADDGRTATAPLRIVGAHTDSPNLRVKPRPDRGDHGFQRVGVEIYGGVLLNSWLDRDLGLSGRVVVREGGAPAGRTVLVRDDRPLARIPQLAVHLDRGVNEKGLVLDPQDDLAPVMGLGDQDSGAFQRSLATLAGVDVDDVLAWDVMFHDVVPSCLTGPDEEFVSAPRLDDLLSCHAGTEALVDAAEGEGSYLPVLALFDHEEVGSETATGAAGPLLHRTLRRHLGLSERPLEGSLVLSVDGAHGTHPSRGHRHDPEHPVRLDGGPVLKANARARYATDAPGVALVRLAAERAGVALQTFVSRNDMPCGSTIGPITAARTGLRTVDLGVAQLAMHSAREFCGSDDPAALHGLLVELLTR